MRKLFLHGPLARSPQRYFGATIPVDAVAHVLAGKKLDAKLVERITTERTLADLKNDLAAIAY